MCSYFYIFALYLHPGGGPNDFFFEGAICQMYIKVVEAVCKIYKWKFKILKEYFQDFKKLVEGGLPPKSLPETSPASPSRHFFHPQALR